MSNEDIVRDLKLLYDPGEVFEIRMLPKGKGSIFSGYFNNIDKCVDACLKMDGIPEGIYTTINPCKPELLARVCNRIEPQKASRSNLTTETDIQKRKWLMFDVDAKRPTGISASDQEHELAIKTAYELARKLKEEMGFPEAIIGDSGNGAHVEYRIDLPNTKEVKDILESFFKVITSKYNTTPGIDIQTFADANRIWKLKGTLVCKGENMPDRPHRRSKLLEVPENMAIISLEQIQKIVGDNNTDSQKAQKEEIRNTYTPSNTNIKPWDAEKLESYLKEHGIVIENTKKDGDITRFILKTCVINPEHEGHKEAEVHIDKSGIIGYKCHHNSCKGKKWTEARGIIEPGYKEKTNQYKPKLAVNGNGAFDYVNRLIEKHPLHYDTTKQFWIWEDNHYKPVDETYIKLAIFKDVADLKIINKTFQGEVLEAAKLMGRDNDVKKCPDTWIHLKNGVYDLTTGTLHEPTPDYMFSEPIPHNLTNSEDTPTIDKLFAEWVAPEKIPLLNELAAYCLYDGYPIHRIFVLLGRGRNGKGQYRDFLVNLVGDHNRCASALEQLINSRFETARLYQKKLCTMGEINYALLERTAILKMLSGGDPIPAEKKNKEPFDFVNTAKLIVNTNSLPQTSDKTDAFYSRCIILEFCNQFPLGKDIIKTIPDSEYDNFLTKCLRILRELLDRGQFTNEGDIQEKEQEYEKLSNPLSVFINTYYEKDVNGRIATWRMFEDYVTFCNMKGFRKPQNSREFNKMLGINYEVEKKNLVDDETKVNVCWVWVFGLKMKKQSNLSNLSKIPLNSLYIELSENIDKLDKLDKTDNERTFTELIQKTELDKDSVTELNSVNNTVTQSQLELMKSAYNHILNIYGYSQVSPEGLEQLSHQWGIENDLTIDRAREYISRAYDRIVKGG